jgi:hypothetical protein
MERNTRQRSAIRHAIAQANRPLLPLEVLDAAQQDVPGLGIATVYRNLKLLVEEGELQAVNLPGRPVAPGSAGFHRGRPRPHAVRALQRLCRADPQRPDWRQ